MNISRVDLFIIRVLKEEEWKGGERERPSLSIPGFFNFEKSKVKSQFRDEIEREWNVQSV